MYAECLFGSEPVHTWLEDGCMWRDVCVQLLLFLSFHISDLGFSLHHLPEKVEVLKLTSLLVSEPWFQPMDDRAAVTLHMWVALDKASHGLVSGRRRPYRRVEPVHIADVACSTRQSTRLPAGVLGKDKVPSSSEHFQCLRDNSGLWQEEGDLLI